MGLTTRACVWVDVRCMCGSWLGTASFRSLWQRHHHIVVVVIIIVMCVVCSVVLHFHSKATEAAQVASSVGIPVAAVRPGAPSFTLRYAAHSDLPMTLAMMHTYLDGGDHAHFLCPWLSCSWVFKVP